MGFVNRQRELAQLHGWWSSPGAGLGVVWGRRRVGKTALLQHLATEVPTVFHTGAGRPAENELIALSRAAAPLLGGAERDLEARPFADWEEAFEVLAAAARSKRILLVLDELPALEQSAPNLPSLIRAVWDRVQSRSKLKLLLCGSAVRTMEAMQEERSPLYGRVDLSLLLHPFAPHEAALMLPSLRPPERALVWGLVGGMPLYLRWWDQDASVQANLSRLACTPGAPLLTEGQLVLATEAEAGDLARQTLYAIAAGRTKFNEIEQAIRADPTRTLERLVSLRLVERVAPVTEDPRRTRRRIYRIADNFLAFWLGVLDRYRPEIERGLGDSILPVLLESLDSHMGGPWEEAFRTHLRRLAASGDLGERVVAVGRFWTAGDDPGEIDAVALAGRSRQAVLLGEAKWRKRLDGVRIRAELERKAAELPNLAAEPRFAVCAREAVENEVDLLRITAEDIF
ncbi:MAG TPA: ATP-binding protein [Solirubrobacterales bacterium]|nr:ATP-binding protein [Solirubrobacterales bacterium]